MVLQTDSFTILVSVCRCVCAKVCVPVCVFTTNLRNLSVHFMGALTRGWSNKSARGNINKSVAYIFGLAGRII